MRVVFSSHQPHEVKTKETLGRYLFGEHVANWLNFVITNRLLGVLWIIMVIVSLILAIFALNGNINPHWGFLSIAFYSFMILCMSSSINLSIAHKLIYNFFFWYPLTFTILGFTCWIILLPDVRRYIVLGLLPFSILPLFTDSFPKNYRLNGIVLATVGFIVGLFGILSILTLRNSEFNYKFRIPWSNAGTQVDMVSMGFNFMCQYLTNVYEILFKKILYPKKLVNLKGKPHLVLHIRVTLSHIQI